MKIESDKVEIKSGVRFGKTIGSPICLEIKNKDFENWQNVMSSLPVDLSDEQIVQELAQKTITKPRPAHADLAGALKYNLNFSAQCVTVILCFINSVFHFLTSI